MASQAQKTRKKNSDGAIIESLGVEMGNKPPQALDVEQAVLGAMLLEGECVDLAMEELTPSCFYDPKHRMIFEAMVSLVSEHTSVDILTVSNALKLKGCLEEVGGPVMLANLSEKVGSAAHIEYYIKILKQKTVQRELITASYDILHNAFDDTVNMDDLIDNAETKIYNAVQNVVRREVQNIGSLINQAIENLEKKQETFDKFACRMIQHEFSHLDGVLFTDLVAPIRRKMIAKKLQNIAHGKVGTSYKSKIK